MTARDSSGDRASIVLALWPVRQNLLYIGHSRPGQLTLELHRVDEVLPVWPSLGSLDIDWCVCPTFLLRLRSSASGEIWVPD